MTDTTADSLDASNTSSVPSQHQRGCNPIDEEEETATASEPDDDDDQLLLKPLVSGKTSPVVPPSTPSTTGTTTTTNTSRTPGFRSRRTPCDRRRRGGAPPAGGVGNRNRVNSSDSASETLMTTSTQPPPQRYFPMSNICNSGNNNTRRYCTPPKAMIRSTITIMNFLGRVLLWTSCLATVAGVVWYSRELKNNGTDPHLIAWFSAGAFVLLGFPISIYGIVMHLSNYYNPSVQCYVVRILWMVPIYSVESWLCLRFHKHAIYIETLRDCYESYVLYSFFQFLIEVLGGEEALVLMLKDKSPTRGVHMWGFQWCLRPWLMGQPVSRRISYHPSEVVGGGEGGGSEKGELGAERGGGRDGDGKGTTTTTTTTGTVRPIKRVQWSSPFFVKCKVGVLQYVLLKFISAIITLILETKGVYHEGDFTPKGGYLYICLITNLSQCWALYCLIFFYYSTKTELGPIRPVGKFLSVKAVVFFTWWQSVGISILFQMGFIPDYNSKGDEWSSEDVAKALQDYLICIEMFVAAIVHQFVFPHTDYLVTPDGNGSTTGSGGKKRRHNHHHHHRHHIALGGGGGGSNTIVGGGAGGGGMRRLGRKGRAWDAALMHQYMRVGSSDDRSAGSNKSKSSNAPTLASGESDVEMGRAAVTTQQLLGSSTQLPPSAEDGEVESSWVGDTTPGGTFHDGNEEEEGGGVGDAEHVVSAFAGNPSSSFDKKGRSSSRFSPVVEQRRQGFVRALIDSTMPRDIVDETVGMVKGDFHVEKKTLLRHAATSDEYDLFSNSSKRRNRAMTAPTEGSSSTAAVASLAPVGEQKTLTSSVGSAGAGQPSTTKSTKEQD